MTRFLAILACLATLLGALALPVGAAVSAVSASSPDSATDQRTLTLAQLGLAGLTMRDARPAARIAIPVPAAWRSTAVRAQLRFTAPRTIRKGSVLVVTVDGVEREAVPVTPGAGGVTFTVPPRAGARTIVIDLAAKLRTDDDSCAAPGAFLRFADDSTVTLVGHHATARPLLSDLPGAFADRVGKTVTPLTIAVGRDPAPAEVQAAALVAGAAARATGAGVPVHVVGEAPAAVPGALVVIRSDERPARIRIARLRNGRVRLELTGRDVVAAAWAVANARLRPLEGVQTTALDPAVPLIDPEPSGRFMLPAGRLAGTGERRWDGIFQVHPGVELGDQGTVYLDLAYDTPAGGRARVLINGRLLGTARFGTHGRGRQRLRFALVNDYGRARNGDLRPGNNVVTVVTELPPGTCGAAAATPPHVDVLPSSRVAFHAAPRRDRTASLGLWPFPFTQGESWSDSAIVLPAAPKLSELSAVVEMLGAAQRWSVTPALAEITFGARVHGARHTLVLARDRQAAVGAGIAEAPPWRTGLLAAVQTGDATDIVAYGTRALRPLRAGYVPGTVRGASVLVDERGRVVPLAGDQGVDAFSPLPAPWKGPAAILVVLAIGGFLLAWARAHRQVAKMPTPEQSPPR